MGILHPISPQILISQQSQHLGIEERTLNIFVPLAILCSANNNCGQGWIYGGFFLIEYQFESVMGLNMISNFYKELSSLAKKH